MSQNYNDTYMQALTDIAKPLQQPAVWRAGLWAFSAVAAIAAALLAAQLTWQLLTPAPAPASGPLQVDVSQAAPIDINALKARNLFGNATQVVTTQTQSAPRTRLNLRLLGVTASSDPSRSAAIIEQSGQQSMYIIGDALGNSAVKVLEIYADRVILDNAGRRETLELEGIGELSPGLSLTMENAVGNQQQQQQQQQQQVEVLVQQPLTTQQQALAQSVLDYVRISPVRQGASIQGYRLQANKYPEVFAAAGFQNGDLAIAINGQSLTDMNTAMTLTRSLGSMRQITVTVLRQGKTIDLELAVPASPPGI